MKPSKDFSQRHSAAVKWRDSVRPVIEEIYSYCAPGRETDFQRNPYSTTNDEQTTMTGLGEECATDLAGDLVTYFTPAEAKWASYLVTAPVEEEMAETVLSLVEEREKDLRDEIDQTNYNDIAPQVMFEAASHGTVGMWVDHGNVSMPTYCETVPPSELLVTPGHMGYLDRFREKPVLATALEALFKGLPGVNLDSEKIRVKKERHQFCNVIWGFWLDWDDVNNPQWRYEITVDGDRVTEERALLGPLAGSCPLLVGRFNPQPNRPWGRGPGWKALPDLRVLDKVDEVVLTGLDQSLLPTLIYPDDGFLDLSQGIEAGRAYPAARGFTRENVYEMQKGVNLDYGFFSEERLEARIRAAFYQDGPRQRGETPPTASQWLDERRRVQQRLGKPSAPLWTEFFLPFILATSFTVLNLFIGIIVSAMQHEHEAEVATQQEVMQEDQAEILRELREIRHELAELRRQKPG